MMLQHRGSWQEPGRALSHGGPKGTRIRSRPCPAKEALLHLLRELRAVIESRPYISGSSLRVDRYFFCSWGNQVIWTSAVVSL
jgi:hypothetical protein